MAVFEIVTSFFNFDFLCRGSGGGGGCLFRCWNFFNGAVLPFAVSIVEELFALFDVSS